MIISKQEFGEWLRKTRMEKRFTLRKFARLVDRSPTYISRIERGDFDPPSDETIRKIAQQLEQNVDDLLGMAGKISNDLTNIIANDPINTAQFLRTAQGLSTQGWKDCISTAENSKKRDNK